MRTRLTIMMFGPDKSLGLSAALSAGDKECAGEKSLMSIYD